MSDDSEHWKTTTLSVEITFDGEIDPVSIGEEVAEFLIELAPEIQGVLITREAQDE